MKVSIAASFFDESVHMQVLNNKNLFQARENIVWLGQSRCGGFAYPVHAVSKIATQSPSLKVCIDDKLTITFSRVC